MQKWKCTDCNFIYAGNTALHQCPKCGSESSYAKINLDRAGPVIQWKCRVCGYSYEDDYMMELCPFCKAECPFVDNSNYLPPDQQQQKPFTDKRL
jgi:rubrerythrin